MIGPGSKSINLFKKSFIFRSPTKHIPTESFLFLLGNCMDFAISLTSGLVKFASGNKHCLNSFELTS